MLSQHFKNFRQNRGFFFLSNKKHFSFKEKWSLDLGFEPKHYSLHILNLGCFSLIAGQNVQDRGNNASENGMLCCLDVCACVCVCMCACVCVCVCVCGR